MKGSPLPASAYTFNASSRTITFLSPYIPANIQSILHITNITRSGSGVGKVVYFQPQDETNARGGTYASPVLTLATGITAGHSDSDTLLILIDDGAQPATEATQAAILGSAGTSPPALPGGATGFPGWFRWLGLPLGSPSDAAVTDPSLSGTLPALVKGVLSLMASRLPVTGGRLQVSNQHDQPLTQTQLGMAALATAAKQPAFGTAGSPAVDVISIQGVASGTPQNVASLLVYATATFTRPNDNTQYAANDVIGPAVTAVLTFANCARVNGGSGVIIGARHFKNTNTTLNASFRLHLYRIAPTAIADNAVFTMAWTDGPTRIGILEFGHITGGTGSDSSEGVGTFSGAALLQFICDSGSTSIFGILTTLSSTGYIPTGAEQHRIELQIQQS